MAVMQADRGRNVVLLSAFVLVGPGCDVGLTAVQFDCGALEAPAPSGGCQPVGVPPQSCSISPDGRGGCVMTADECGGLMTPLNPCASSCPPPDPQYRQFPYLDDDLPKVYVDAAYPRERGEGSIERPFARIEDALPLAESYELSDARGAIIVLAQGTYTENLRIRGRIVLVGACAAETAIRGLPEDPVSPVLRLELGDNVRNGLPGVSFVSVEAPGDGIDIAGWSDGVIPHANHWATLEGIRVSAEGYGVRAVQAGVSFEHTLIEHAVGVGIDLTRSVVHVMNTAVQATTMSDGRARGIAVHPGEGEVTITSSFIDAQPEVGVFAEGARVTLEDTLIRGGIVVKRDVQSRSDAALTVRASVVENSGRAGIEVVDATTIIESTVIRGTDRDATSCHGQSLNVLATGSDSFTTTVRQSLLENSRTAAVQVLGSVLLLDRVLVRETLPEACTGSFGDGVSAIAGARVTIRGSRIETSARAGVVSFGAETSINATALSCNTTPLAPELFGPSSSTVFTDGTTVCGCATSWAPCRAASFGFEPRTSAGSACHLLVNDGANVDVLQVDKPLPLHGKGGEIQDGEYVLIDVSFYTGVGGATGPTGNTVRSKIDVHDEVIRYVDDVYDERGQWLESFQRFTGTLTTKDGWISITNRCPDQAVQRYAYTADGDTLSVILPPENSWTFERRAP